MVLYLYLVGLAWVSPKSVIELLECWQGWFQQHRGAKVWQALPLCVIWNLSFEGNRWVFDVIEHPSYVINERILQTLFDWMHALGSIPYMTFCSFY